MANGPTLDTEAVTGWKLPWGVRESLMVTKTIEHGYNAYDFAAHHTDVNIAASRSGNVSVVIMKAKTNGYVGGHATSLFNPSDWLICQDMSRMFQPAR